jgi:hypothetical protein
MSLNQGDTEAVTAAALSIARDAEAMQAHTTLRLAHLLRQQSEEWPEVVAASLRELSEAQGMQWDWSPSETARFIDLADYLFDTASGCSGRARAALHRAAEAVADLEMQQRDVFGLTRGASHIG